MGELKVQVEGKEIEAWTCEKQEAAAKAVPEIPVKRLQYDLYEKGKIDGRWGSVWPRAGLLFALSQ
jgi:hypothetical protein